MASLGTHYHPPSTLSHASNGSVRTPNGLYRAPSRSRTPNPPSSAAGAAGPLQPPPDLDLVPEEDPQSSLFADLFERAETRLAALFGEATSRDAPNLTVADAPPAVSEEASAQINGTTAPPRKAARTIDEDDYDDPDEAQDDQASSFSPLKAKSTGSTTIPRVRSPSKIGGVPLSPALTSANGPTSQWQGKSSDDMRKRLEADKKFAEEAARKSFYEYFYPLDNDRDTMLEQQRLEESERQIDAEMSNAAANNQANEGTLSSANLGTSSLVLKHLIARIDAKRDQVLASDQELRSLMIEVKKNRSKWANEDKIGQEELYEAAEKVLSEIKAQTEHSQPFLQRVNKRDAPDYYHVIKHPMDLSQVTKKLKQLQYKSKQEFVGDLHLIWANCLKYNAEPSHFMRRHAIAMRKLSESLVPLIPDIVIRDRAEVEAEERRQQAIDGDADGAEDSDDEPIISSRGRKAPGKKSKKGAPTTSRKAPADGPEGTPGAEQKPSLGSSLPARSDFLRADSDTAMEGSQNGLSTPPPGTITPAGLNGITASSQVDPMEVDGFAASVQGAAALAAAQIDYEDPLYKTWKQVTKKDRAALTAERHRLFKKDRLDGEEPALLRTRGGMRRWARNQREAEDGGMLGKRKRDDADEPTGEPTGETLAEGMQDSEERVLPDYYDTMNALPDLEKSLQWKEDSEGVVVPASEDTLRIVPSNLFCCPRSAFAQRMNDNMRQMQETRKVCTKIGVVKQMQQAQIYQSQFQKHEIIPLIEPAPEPYVASDDGPVMTPTICRAAMQRSVAKIFYTAGFEECQPSALDAITDLANDFFVRLASTFHEFLARPQIPISIADVVNVSANDTTQQRYTMEECILQALNEHGIELNALEQYAKDDSERLSAKLIVLHERMKAHLAELLRPALAEGTNPDGDGAYNDNSEMFLQGDFAEDIEEDFFGFKELGLDREFGLSSLSVPLHLLQNRMHSAYQTQNASTMAANAASFPTPVPYKPVTIQSLPLEIGLIQNFFLAKLHANNDQPLVEDEDLPQKQRLPKPRLPPTGKITSPRKKPVREQGPGKGHPKKKMRFIDGQWIKESEVLERERQQREEKERREKLATKDQQQTPTPQGGSKGGSKLGARASLEPQDSQDADGDFDDDLGAANGAKGKLKGRAVAEGGMISPESLEAL